MRRVGEVERERKSLEERSVVLVEDLGRVVRRRRLDLDSRVWRVLRRVVTRGPPGDWRGEEEEEEEGIAMDCWRVVVVGGGALGGCQRP